MLRERYRAINHSDHNAWRKKQHHLLIGHDDLPLLIQAVVVTPLNHICTVGECAGGDVYQFAGSAVLQLEEAGVPATVPAALSMLSCGYHDMERVVDVGNVNGSHTYLDSLAGRSQAPAQRSPIYR